MKLHILLQITPPHGINPPSTIQKFVFLKEIYLFKREKKNITNNDQSHFSDRTIFIGFHMTTIDCDRS